MTSEIWLSFFATVGVLRCFCAKAHQQQQENIICWCSQHTWLREHQQRPGVMGINKFTISADSVFDSKTNSSVEVSLNQLIAWQTSQTLLDFQLEDPSTGGSVGSVYYGTRHVFRPRRVILIGNSDFRHAVQSRRVYEILTRQFSSV